MRCGRVGTNAFRQIAADDRSAGWICLHEEPCIARMRTRHRSGARAMIGRPPTSPIAPAHLSERPACVIGSDPDSVDVLADALVGFAAAEVDRLDPSRRSLDQLSRRDYGLVVVDAQEHDPVAFLNELTRRLGTRRRRDRAVLVCSPPTPTPAIERLTADLGVPSVPRPAGSSSFMAAVSAAVGEGRDSTAAAVS